MKKVLAWVLTLMAAVSMIALGYAEGGLSFTEESRAPAGVQKGTEIVVGSVTALSGCFATELWSANTADLDALALLHGYSTVWRADWSGAGFLVDETIIRDLQTKDQADGSRIYTITLPETLTYNDGTPITAKDYLFSLLLSGAKEIRQLGGTPKGLFYIAGYEEYSTGQTNRVSGLRLISEFRFSIQIRQEYQTYFYLNALLDATPYPVHVIAPGCDVMDDGGGVYMGTADSAADMDANALGFTPGVFGVEMLRKTMLDPESGYVYRPMVTSGPYQLVSFNRDLREARFVVNPRYAGNYEGKTPHIESLVFRLVENETMVAQLAEGKVHLLNKVTSGVTLNEAFVLADDLGQVQTIQYPRSGAAFLVFACEQNIPSSVNVRRAIAYCIDKLVYVASAVNSYSAMAVHGYYGIGQWMVISSFAGDEEAGIEPLNTFVELEKLQIPMNLEMAKELLAEDGWVLNASGEPYAEGDGIRYRDKAGTLVPLMIRWAKTANNPIADATERMLEGPLAAVGIELRATEVPFSEMLTLYYRQADRSEYDMFFLAKNFTPVFDPYYDFSTAEEYHGTMNTTGLRDEELWQLAANLRMTNSMDERGYVEKWLAFQDRWVEIMPMIPLYSNVYFDFYTNELQDYTVDTHDSWAKAIVDAWIGEAAPPGGGT